MTKYVVTVYFDGLSTWSTCVEATSERNAMNKVKIILSKGKKQRRKSIRRITVEKGDIPY